MAGIGEASVDETETHPVSWDSPPEEGIRQQTTFHKMVSWMKFEVEHCRG